MNRTRLPAAGLLGLNLVVSACSSVAPTHTSRRLHESGFPVKEERPASVNAGSELEFKFFFAPELDDKQTVRQDGYVSLQLVGDVQVGGKTPQAIREHLQSLYAEHLKNPEVVVILRKRVEDRVLVAGAVEKPIIVALNGEVTALDALMFAGGPKLKTANIRNVVVIREHQGRRQGYRLDLGPSLSGKTGEPFFLQSRDIVFVPRTEITDLNQFIDQYINNMIPLGFTYTVPVGAGRIGVAPGFVQGF